jgi:hypothetical protein
LCMTEVSTGPITIAMEGNGSSEDLRVL